MEQRGLAVKKLRRTSLGLYFALVLTAIPCGISSTLSALAASAADSQTTRIKSTAKVKTGSIEEFGGPSDVLRTPAKVAQTRAPQSLELPSCLEATQTGLPIYKWGAVGKPKAVVLMMHGLTQDALSLGHLGRMLSEQGFVVYGVDQRGHGWWHFHQKPSDIGYYCDFKNTVRDVDAVIPVLKSEYGSLPLFLVGESAGAAVVLRAAVESKSQVNGIILCGAGDKSCRSKITWLLGDLFGNVCRWHHPFSIVRYILKYSTDNEKVVQTNLNDPFQRKTMSLCEIRSAMNFVGGNRHYAKCLEPQLALLQIQGSNDRVLRVNSACKVFEAARAKDKELVMVPDCGHVLISSPLMRPVVKSAIINFINEKTTEYNVTSGHSRVSSLPATDRLTALTSASTSD